MPENEQPIAETTDAIMQRLLPQVVPVVSGELDKVPGIRVLLGDAHSIALCLARQKLLMRIREALVPAALQKIDIAGKIRALTEAFACDGITHDHVYGLFKNAPKLLPYKTSTLTAKINLVAEIVHFEKLLPFGTSTANPADALPFIMRERVFAEMVATKKVQMYRAVLVAKMAGVIVDEKGGCGVRTLSGALHMTSGERLDWIMAHTDNQIYGRFRNLFTDARIAKPEGLKKSHPHRPVKGATIEAGAPPPP